jgi:hypothetical protein
MGTIIPNFQNEKYMQKRGNARVIIRNFAFDAILW